MPAHLCAFSSVVPTDTLVSLDALVDDVLTRTATDRYLVPSGINNIIWKAALSTNLTKAYPYAPSLEVRRTIPYVVPAVSNATSFPLGSVPIDRPMVPISLVPTEELSFKGQASANVRMYGLVLLGSSPLEAPPAGDVRIVRCTGTTTLTPNTWTTVKITPDVSLEAGTYALVGMVAISSGAIAARAIIRGQVWRPGVPAFAGAENTAINHEQGYRNFYSGFLMGTFGHLDIPEIQFLSSSADTSEVVYLHLVKTA